MADWIQILRRGVVAGLLASAHPAFAQQDLVNRESADRAQNAERGYTLIEEGDVFYREGKYEEATGKYQEALRLLPAEASTISGLRNTAVQRYVQSGLVYAQDLKRLGDYGVIRNLLGELKAVAPKNRKIEAFEAKLDDPIRTNPALTKAHSVDVDRVRRLLYQAEGYYDLAQFDRAEMTYEDVLRIDKYNKAARRGMERSAAARTEYYITARDQTRGQALAEVEKGWELPDAQNLNVPEVSQQEAEILAFNKALDINTKLDSLILETVSLNDSSLEEAVDFLRSFSRRSDPEEKGVSFVINLGDKESPAVQAVESARINLEVRNVPLRNALQLITDQVGATYQIDEFAIRITAEGFEDPTLINRTFRVPPGFLTSSAGPSQAANSDPFGAAAGAEGRLFAARVTAIEKLKGFGVNFPDGAFARYSDATSVLQVRNTAANLRKIEAVVDSVNKAEPVIVMIRTTVIDVAQDNLEEIGYDLILNELSAGSQTLSGGTVGNGRAVLDGLIGNPVTSGLRSGELVGGAGGIDAAIARENPSADTGAAIGSPGVLSLIGVINDRTHQLLLRGLDQKKGTDLMIQPAVATKSGQNAVVESVLEFIYPTEYEPPELPNSVGGGSGNSNPVTPATPSAFETTNLGVSLEVLPQVGPDRQIIELQVSPVIRDFEGFVNYGSPITGTNNQSTFSLLTGFTTGSSVSGEVTSNEILQPVFRTTRTNTNVSIGDGQTIVLGGLLQEIRETVKDQVPILGSVPLLGRFFQTDAIAVEKRSILILVNVELLDPAGNRYRNR